MPAATNGDFQFIHASEPNRLHQVLISRGLHDKLRVTRRLNFVPNQLPPAIFVAGIRESCDGSLDRTSQIFHVHVGVTPAVHTLDSGPYTLFDPEEPSRGND
jgi:hypothetical protein